MTSTRLFLARGRKGRHRNRETNFWTQPTLGGKISRSLLVYLTRDGGQKVKGRIQVGNGKRWDDTRVLRPDTSNVVTWVENRNLLQSLTLRSRLLLSHQRYYSLVSKEVGERRSDRTQNDIGPETIGKRGVEEDQILLPVTDSHDDRSLSNDREQPKGIGTGM